MEVHHHVCTSTHSESEGEAHGTKQCPEHTNIHTGAVGVAWSFIHEAANHEAGGVAKAHIAPRHNGQEQHLVQWELGLLLTVMCTLCIDLWRALQATQYNEKIQSNEKDTSYMRPSTWRGKVQAAYDTIK